MTAPETAPRVLIDLRRKPRPTDWTPEQIATLRRMAGKATAADIAAAVGRSVRSTQVKAHRLNLSLALSRSHDRWTSQEIVTLRHMAATHTMQEAAEALGRSYRSVQNKATRQRIAFQKYGDAYHSTRYDLDSIRRIVALRTQGQSYKRIGAAVGMSEANVANIVLYRWRWRDTMRVEQAAHP